MTENKTSSNKHERNQETDKQLLPRLKLMGYLMLGFSICAFIYAVITESPAIDYIEDEIEEFQEIHHFNSYVVATSFVTVGLACLFCVWKKKKSTEQ